MAANHFLPDAQHSEATTVIPFIGGSIACGAILAYKQLEEIEIRWLNEAVTERRRPEITQKNQEELDADIASRRKALQELQWENTKVQ